MENEGERVGKKATLTDMQIIKDHTVQKMGQLHGK